MPRIFLLVLNRIFSRKPKITSSDSCQVRTSTINGIFGHFRTLNTTRKAVLLPNRDQLGLDVVLDHPNRFRWIYDGSPNAFHPTMIHPLFFGPPIPPTAFSPITSDPVTILPTIIQIASLQSQVFLASQEEVHASALGVHLFILAGKALQSLRHLSPVLEPLRCLHDLNNVLLKKIGLRFHCLRTGISPQLAAVDTLARSYRRSIFSSHF